MPDVQDHAALAEVLSAQVSRKVEIVGNPGGERRVWLTMALQNATLAIRQKLALKATQEDRLAALQEALGLAASGATDRMLRRLAHDGRGGRGVLRDLRPARDAVVGVSTIQCHARARRGRLRGAARSADAAMRRVSSPASIRRLTCS